MSDHPLSRTRATLAALAGALTLTMVSTGCDRIATEATLAASQVDATGTQVVTGEIGPGALYRLDRPEAWNGRLVLFAHGGVTTQPIELTLLIDPMTSE